MARATQAVVKAVDTQTEDDVEAAIGEVHATALLHSSKANPPHTGVALSFEMPGARCPEASLQALAPRDPCSAAPANASTTRNIERFCGSVD